MRKLFASTLLCFFVFTGAGQQSNKGTVVIRNFLAPSIQNNKAGEEPMRRVTVYLPPGYENSDQRYPCIYFLHGYSVNDSLMMAWLGFNKLMDSAIRSGKIRPVILVLPDSDTKFKGSFYTNSLLTGSWSDFIAKDVVNYIDKNFRTIPKRDSRGLCGHSMGGNGALKMAMLHADVFSSVYALSPAILDWYGDFTLRSGGFKKVSKIKTEKELFDGMEDTDMSGFYAAVFTNLGRTYSPEENNKSFQAKLPVTYIGDSAVVSMEIVKQWEANFPMNMIEDHLPALKSLHALKLDWGRNEEFTHIPTTCLLFSKKMEAYRVRHFAEEYLGDHGNMLAGFNGRIFTELLPFFEKYLK